MLPRIAVPLGVCLLIATGTAPQCLADPPADPDVVAAADAAPPLPPPNAPLPSGTAGNLTTPDGWKLSVGASGESIEPVASLTNSPWSREYLVDGTFVGEVSGSGTTKLAGGTLEAGYQIGCGIIQDDIESITSAGITPGLGIPFVSGTILPVFISPSVTQQIKIDLKPGTVNIVPIGKKSFKGTKSRVSITGFRVKIDGCAGQSFIRSYATFTSSTDNTDDVVTYLGVTKAV
ncbi:MspA family porin [Mycobacterium sp. CVI_P3]|uniref:MspA family porin n=1 Tax=Mycobacterium pinniadriaticum TaxID=2994102 RepID=A0ABT3SEX6_9MYCO|nr:MspA family porin [Mycobacterium pinniadriaticum]MCX2931537.1 MspA family porin [Mycobacterium pinniadriaticum]MCX2938071.1 MspA family porin [Mycobacterium pinniadriaticum]